MKLNRGLQLITLLFFVFLLLSSSSSARLVKNYKQGLEKVGTDLIKRATNPSKDTVDFSNLMGSESEECDGEKYTEEECFKRRMIAEAHLDYIYTQKHKP